MVVLRRLIRDSLVLPGDQKTNQQGELLGMVELLRTGDLYEYAVLVTPWNEGILGIA